MERGGCHVEICISHSHSLPAEKHTQYSFKHLAFLQLHLLDPPGCGPGSGRIRPWKPPSWN